MEQEQPFSLRMKVGAHEFEATGDPDSVREQLAIWRELIGTVPTTSPSPPPATGPKPVSASATAATESLNGVTASAIPTESVSTAAPVATALETAGYDKIFHRAGKVVSLTVLPHGDTREGDAALLVLLGQRHYNQLDRVGGSLMLSGLQQSGINAERADRVLERYTPDLVLRDGIRRAVKYRLNNQGYNRARELAKDLIAMLP